MTLRSALAAAILAFLVPAQALAQDAALLHADTPLWAPDGKTVWPQHVFDADSFGCAHRIQLGAWRYKPADTEQDDSWYSFSNYGVMHCWMNVAEGDDPETFADSRPSFLIQLGRVGSKELWALQMGARPGSDYILLARPVGKGSIERFEVLQRRCPKARMRGGPSLDILITRYCSINTQGEMLALAKSMAKLPPLGVMTFEPKPS